MGAKNEGFLGQGKVAPSMDRCHPASTRLIHPDDHHVELKICAGRIVTANGRMMTASTKSRLRPRDHAHGYRDPPSYQPHSIVTFSGRARIGWVAKGSLFA